VAINLKKYQEQAVEQLVDASIRLLKNTATKKLLVFQAPTGSGKTVMTAMFIKDLIEQQPDENLCFLWVSIGKGNLHKQSKKALEKYFEGAPKVLLLEDEYGGSKPEIARNEVVVVNWEKLRTKDRGGDWKNVVMRNGENTNFRQVLTNTRSRRKIILIIDESHFAASSESAIELRDEIDADIVLEMSATPKFQPSAKDMALGIAAYVPIDSQAVIDEEMIKKEIIINENLDDLVGAEADSQSAVLEAAYKKRLELLEYFKELEVPINPLVLIQLPNRDSDPGNAKRIAAIEFLASKDISLQDENNGNGKLAIWLDDEPKAENIDRISNNNSEIEFLIFKQAIDTGWDCPRAHILVKFREVKSESFEIQTVGRILRMPEQKHYQIEALNKGYIFTNVESIIVSKEDYNPNIIKHLKGSRQKDYADITLTSFFKSRADYGDITASFIPEFEKTANEYFGIKGKDLQFIDNVRKVEKKGITLEIDEFRQPLVLNAAMSVRKLDDQIGEVLVKDHVSFALAENDLLSLYETCIKLNMGSFRNIKRSVPIIKSAIYIWFRNYLGSKNWQNSTLQIQKIFCHSDNYAVFSNVLGLAVARYEAVKKLEVLQRVLSSEIIYEFEIPSEIYFNHFTHEEVQMAKSILQPCFLEKGRSKPERQFEEFLQTNNDIAWWWKNGVSTREYFGIRYEYPADTVHTFYPDYLVKHIDGTIGIYEVKSATDPDGIAMSTAKAEALYKFVEINSSKKRPLVGGFVIPKSRDILLHNQEVYDWAKTEKGDWSDWKSFPKT
jgi:type III restriction enzyme